MRAGACGVDHQRADGVVAAQVSPDLLLDQRGGLRSQDGSGAALVGFQFVEGVLDFPALGVGQSQLLRGGVGGVEDRGQ